MTKGQGALDSLLLIGGGLIIAAIVTTMVIGIGTSGQSAATASVNNTEMQKQKTLYGYSLPGGVSRNGLVAYYKFNDNFADVSGNGNNGMPNSSTDPTFSTDARAGKSANFNGITNYLQLPNSQSLEIRDAITIALWAKQYGTIDNATQRTLAGKNVEAYMHISYGQSRFTVYLQTDPGGCGTGYCQAFGGTILPTNTWMHLAGTFDGKTIKIYENGILKQSRAWVGTIKDSTNVPYIGGNLWGYSNGLIDEALVFNRALSDAEIATLAASTPDS